MRRAKRENQEFFFFIGATSSRRKCRGKEGREMRNNAPVVLRHPSAFFSLPRIVTIKTSCFRIFDFFLTKEVP